MLKKADEKCKENSPVVFDVILLIQDILEILNQQTSGYQRGKNENPITDDEEKKSSNSSYYYDEEEENEDEKATEYEQMKQLRQ